MSMLRLRRGLIAGVVACAIVAGCAGRDEGDDGHRAAGTPSTTTSAPVPDALSRESFAPYEPLWTARDCGDTGSAASPIDPDIEVSCGTLTVPENRREPQGNLVELAVRRIGFVGEGAAPDPVVYLHGGPGSGVYQSGSARWERLAHELRREVIVFDQRGVGASSPNLNCPEREDAFIEVLSGTAGWDVELANIQTALSTCFERLNAAGHDLSQYNTFANAADLADLRVALGIDAWNLWGVSYGTRLALTALRFFPEGIRSVVLDSVSPPSAANVYGSLVSGREAFDRLVNGCGTEPACNERYGDIRPAIDAIYAAMNEQPAETDLTVGDQNLHLRLDGSDSIAGLFNAMYDTTLIPQLPAVITDLAAGGRGIVAMIAQVGIPFINSMTEGAYLSYECADNTARIEPSEVDSLIEDPGEAATLLLAGWNLFCEQWPIEPLPVEFGDVVTRDLVPDDVAVIVFAGEYDPITPSDRSREVAEAIDALAFVEIPRGGHGAQSSNSCTKGLFLRFINDPTQLDTTCVASIPVVPFA